MAFRITTDDGKILTTKNDLVEWLNNAVENDPAIRRDMAKIFQQANRRMQNIEQSMQSGRIGFSPAYQAAIAYTGDAGGHFSKFHMVRNWDMMLEQTAQAAAFLNEPTSTASGARKWQREMLRGITTRTGRELSEREASRFMRAVYTDVYDYDEQFKEIAAHYIVSRTEMQVQQSKNDMQSFINSYIEGTERSKLSAVQTTAGTIAAIAESFTNELLNRLHNSFTPIK